jgi:hypothetical protein
MTMSAASLLFIQLPTNLRTAGTAALRQEQSFRITTVDGLEKSAPIHQLNSAIAKAGSSAIMKI